MNVTMNAEKIERWFIERIASYAELSAEEVDLRIPFERYGIDSRTAASLSGELEEWLGVPIPATLLWDYPTIFEAACFLSGQCAQIDSVPTRVQE